MNLGKLRKSLCHHSYEWLLLWCSESSQHLSISQTCVAWLWTITLTKPHSTRWHLITVCNSILFVAWQSRTVLGTICHVVQSLAYMSKLYLIKTESQSVCFCWNIHYMKDKQPLLTHYIVILRYAFIQLFITLLYTVYVII